MAEWTYKKTTMNMNVSSICESLEKDGWEVVSVYSHEGDIVVIARKP